MASGGPSRARRRRARQAVLAAQGPHRPLSGGTVPAEPTAGERRWNTRQALIASGAVPRDLLANYDLAQGTPAEQWFLAEALAAGFEELHADHWPCELPDLLGVGDLAVGFRDGHNNLVYKLPDGTLAHVTLAWDTLHVRIAGPSHDAVHTAYASFREAFPASYLIDGDDRVPITFWTDSPFGPVSRLRKIDAASWEDVAANYPGVLRDELAGLMGWNDTGRPAGQLLLWQGPPGTGKTWALRALASEWAPWAEFHYITDPDAFFVDNPSYMVNVLLSDSYGAIEPATGDVYDEQREGKWRVLILEDTGELLAEGAKDTYGQGLSRLLNVVDGMIGQGLRVLALVTTNDELGALHPAVMRPGRCAAQTTFGPFPADEAAAWLAAQPGITDVQITDPGEEYTLAELYTMPDAVEPVAAVSLEEFAERLPCSGCDHAYTDHLGTEGPCTVSGCSCNGYQADEATAVRTAEPGEAPVAASSYADGAVALPVELQPADILPPARPSLPAPPSEVRSGATLEWEATFAPEGVPTSDGRMFAPGALSWRELPLTLMAMLETQEGHDGAVVSGRIESIWRDEAAGLIRASGVFDDADFGRDVARLVGDGTLRGLSVDIAIRSSEAGPESDYLDENGLWRGTPADRGEEGAPEADLLEQLLGPPLDEPLVYVVTDGVIGAATVCPFPAFAEANISLLAAGFVWRHRMQGGFTVVRIDGEEFSPPPLVASGLEVPVAPPAEWFTDPGLDAPTPVTVTDEGRIFGHVAPWGTCHIGFADTCVLAPRSQTAYRLYHLGEVVCDDGSRVPCGKLTIGTGHADARLDAQAAARHYDHTGSVFADVVSGEDDHGIWFSGALRPGLTAENVREIRASVLSGDWRNHAGNLELVAVLAVNVPGFPIPRAAALVAAGGIVSLVSPSFTDAVPAGALGRLQALAAAAHGGFPALAALAAGNGVL